MGVSQAASMQDDGRPWMAQTHHKTTLPRLNVIAQQCATGNSTFLRRSCPVQDSECSSARTPEEFEPLRCAQCGTSPSLEWTQS
eukprot:4913309-Amphidinium_carterae.1